MTRESGFVSVRWIVSALLVGGCASDDVTVDDNTGGPTSTTGMSTSVSTSSATSEPTTSSTTTPDESDDSETGITTETQGSTGPDTTTEPGSESTSPSTGEETSSSSSSSSSGGESSSSSSSTGEAMQVCPYGDISAPDTVMGSTTGEDSEFGSACGGNGAPDVSYVLTAPADGVYVFDTFGSSMDTILSVRDGVCAGPVLACNNDDPVQSPDSSVSVDLVAGQTVTVVVDSFSVGGGSFTLNVAYYEGICPNGDLGNTVPLASSGSTVASDNTLFGSCGGNGAPDEAFTFTAPSPGIYTIDTLGADFDTVLYVRDACLGTELACNDNGLVDDTSRLIVTLEEDEQVVVVVDGANAESGNFDINVELDACPDADLGSTVPQTVTGSTFGLIDQAAGSCPTNNGAPDVAYTFTAATAETYVFDTNGSALDTRLYVFDGATCSGTELACDDQGGAEGNASQVVLDLDQDQLVTIMVDGWNGASGDYVLNVHTVECGNDLLDPGESCDGASLGGQTCATFGFGGGTLACNPDCTVDMSGCNSCGDNFINGSDVCDGLALAATKCEDLGFGGGTLDCAPGCASFDTAECSNTIIAVCSQPAAPLNAASPTIDDTIMVPDMGTIADVDLFVDATHAWTGDIDITLEADDLGLSNQVAFDACLSQNDVWAFFNDEGNAAVGFNCNEPFAWEGNLFSQTPLSVYDGGEVNGSWTLHVVDDFPGADDGVLNEWCLYVTLE